MNKETPQCALCSFKASERICRKEKGKSPEYCPTENKPDLVQASLKICKDDSELCEFACQSAIQEAAAYTDKEFGYDRVRPSQTRIEEIMGFARRMNYKKLGMAFCIGLRKEAKIVSQIFASRGFDIASVICKAGRISKQAIGVEKHQQLDPDAVETMCNPIFQAEILNEQETDFNILLGLCVGHDSLFFKYSQAPCTVLAVKDRLLGHNPLAAVYNVDSYYRSLK